MSEVKHTPGPWEAGRPDMGTEVDGYLSKWIYAGDKYVAAASGMDVKKWDEVMANANLIAAAPDLLKTCEDALEFIEGFVDGAPDASPTQKQANLLFRDLTAALAKAEGKI